ncbi:MAG TPA: copper chaperone PCu(A)C [Streptosporangiaceae bacterium]|nr:copper chaperone PCu(A)C [Streptosporangiaceae bacterium]
MIRSSHGSKLLRRLLVGAIAVLVPVLAGCEAGNNAPTLQFHQAANGAYGTVGPISVINAFVLGPAPNAPLPAGSSASFFLGLYNGGSQADKLVSVSAPGSAASVQISGGPIALPAQQATYLTGPAPKLVLAGLTRPLSGGQTINVVLTFQNAGSVTLTVPVEPRSNYYATYSPPAAAAAGAVTSSPSTGASATPSTVKPSASAGPSASASPHPSATK